MSRIQTRDSRPSSALRALAGAGGLLMLGAAPAAAAGPSLGVNVPPPSILTIAALLGAGFSLGFFAVAFLLDQLKEGGAPEGLKMLLGGVGAAGLGVTAILFALSWPGHGYPEPEPDRTWSPEMKQARLDSLARLDDYGLAADDGENRQFHVPVSRAMQDILDDPAKLAPQAITLSQPWEEMPLAERGRLIYEGLAMQQMGSVPGYAACKTCHSTDGTRILGPSFQGRWGTTAATSAGPVTFDRAYVVESVHEPMAKVADTYPPVMPAMPLTDEQIDAIVAFLQTL